MYSSWEKKKISSGPRPTLKRPSCDGLGMALHFNQSLQYQVVTHISVQQTQNSQSWHRD